MLDLLTLHLDPQTKELIWEFAPTIPIHAAEIVVALREMADALAKRECRPIRARAKTTNGKPVHFDGDHAMPGILDSVLNQTAEDLKRLREEDTGEKT